MARLKEKYNQEIKNNLQKKLGISNVMEVPEIKKVTVNMGVGEAVQSKKTIEKAVARSRKIIWSKGINYSCKKISCIVQDKRRNAYGCQSNIEKRKDVRIFG